MFDEQVDEAIDEFEELALPALPNERLEQVRAWGRASSSVGYVYGPSTVDGVRRVFEIARENGRSVGFRAGGNSYGDAAMNAENIVLDMRRMNRILEWEPENGRITVEPGVTLHQLWEYILGDGWWIPIATGTMKTTVGGCAAMNTHGKNAWNMGVFGDHILEFDFLLPTGELISCSREQNEEMFYGALGGFGMLGCFISFTLQMKRIYSGLLNVEGLIKPNLAETFAYFDDHLHDSDYLVAWADAFARGKALGRTEIHRANYLRPGEDPHPSQTLRVDKQHLPENIMGLIPRSVVWRLQRPFWNNFWMRYVNLAKFRIAQFKGQHSYQQSHARFHFLLDYFDWNKPFGPGGMIQYQPFIPKENALDAFNEILRLCQKRGFPNFLTVLKRHRTDPFLISYCVDGYSMAMDFRITARQRGRIVALMRELDEIVLAANGRFYFAKDSTLRPQIVRASLGQERIEKFMALKQRCDPEGLIQTNLWRRLFT